MREPFLPIFDSLGFRLLAPLFITVGVVLTVHAVVSFASIKEHFLRLVEADIRPVERADHSGQPTTACCWTARRKCRPPSSGWRRPEIANIRVYDKKGFVAISAVAKEIGQRIDIDSETCRSCHPDKTARDTAVPERRTVAQAGQGREVLRHLSVIANEPSCSAAACHVHPPTQRALGVLDVEMSMAPLEATVRASRQQLLGTTLILVFIIGLVAAVFVRRVVQRPARQLSHAIQRIAGGDLDTRIQVRGRHELARLAEAFNRMAGDLSDARREVTTWSQRLEEKVVEKTEELGRAQRQVLQMEKMASLGKLSATVAHELNNPLSGMLTYARLVRRELAEQPIERRRPRRDDAVPESGGEGVQPLRRDRPKPVALRPAEGGRHGLRRSQRGGRAEPDARAAPPGNQPRQAAQRAAGGRSADRGRRRASLQQALVALLVNAVEAMKRPEDEGGELSVRLCGSADEVRLTSAIRASVFRPRCCRRSSTPSSRPRRRRTASGLGLPVVYGIVRRHGGQISVESKVGQGTVFHLRLPRQPGPGGRTIRRWPTDGGRPDRRKPAKID